MNAQAQNREHQGATEEIFLTPRVVDRRAFETFASMLRASVEKAEHESDLLARRAEAAASVLERLEGFVGSHADVFKRAADLIDTIDQRQRTAGDTLDALTKRVELAQQAARDVESLVRERGESFEARLTTLAQGTLDSFEAARQTLSGDASIMRRDLSQRLDELRQRGESLLASLEERAEHAGQGLAEQLTHLETARETLRVEHRETTRKLDEQSSELREGLRTEGSAVKRELDAAARSLREAIAASSAHRDTIERAAELAVGRVQAGASEQTLEVERLVRRAEGLLRDHGQSVESLSAEIEARLESARDRAETELGQASSNAKAKAREIETTLNDRIAAAQSAASTLLGLENATDEAGRLIESIEGRQDSVRAQIAAMVEEVCTGRLEAVRNDNARLDASLSAADEERASLREVVREQQDRLERCDRENAELRVALELSESKQASLREELGAQNDRLAALEKQLAGLVAAKAESNAAPEAEEPEAEPLVPVVVKSTSRAKPKKKAPTRKKAPSKKAASKKASSKATTKKPAARKATTKKATSTTRTTTRKKAPAKAEGDEAEAPALTAS